MGRDRASWSGRFVYCFVRAFVVLCAVPFEPQVYSQCHLLERGTSLLSDRLRYHAEAVLGERPSNSSVQFDQRDAPQSTITADSHQASQTTPSPLPQRSPPLYSPCSSRFPSPASRSTPSLPLVSSPTVPRGSSAESSRIARRLSGPRRRRRWGRRRVGEGRSSVGRRGRREGTGRCGERRWAGGWGRWGRRGGESRERREARERKARESEGLLRRRSRGSCEENVS